jgi:hypothetical protein
MAALLVLRAHALLLREAATALAIQQRLLPAYVAACAVAFVAYFVLLGPYRGVGAASALILAETTLLIGIAATVLRAAAARAAFWAPLGAAAGGLIAAGVALWLQSAGYGFVVRTAAAGGIYGGLLLLTGTVSLPALKALGAELLAGKGRRA